jgi:leader peptidase (prepilin peptidase) / N-methyltransferase
MSEILASIMPAVDTLFRTFAAAAFGLAIGSFLTVVAYRVPRHESIVAPRSRCPGCGVTIRTRDNVPVLSYLLLRGKCRSCGARISPRYVVIELLTAGLFAAAAARFPSVYMIVVLAMFFAVLVAVAVIDVEHRVIPNRILYPSLLFFPLLLAVGVLTGEEVSLVRAVIGFLAYGGGLLVVALISPGGMGMGDVKLAALIGLVLGAFGLSYVAVAAAVAILGGGLGAVALLAFARASRKRAVPFGPYLAAGAVWAAFVAPRVAHWYEGFLR